MHPNSPYNQSYDFDRLINHFPPLSEFRYTTPDGSNSVNFADPKAVISLNKALLLTDFGIKFWDIPEGYLCPPIPGRADYIFYLAELVGFDTATHSNEKVQRHVRILDVGCGANCIYPLLGKSLFGWSFIGSETDKTALESAENILRKNDIHGITLRHQADANHYFHGILRPNEFVDAMICNPPFHTSLEESLRGTNRKWKHVGKGRVEKDRLNFGGQSSELWCEGGELTFISNLIRESLEFKTQVGWFTCLVSKKPNLPELYNIFDEVEAVKIKTIEMKQGQKTSRFIAWKF
ncbi:MAG: 23S rRNA (adenine(1618)-N(6))-methyltransferase RlmF [Bacteroidetes bacterium]|nr:23S rRNA (adenine(1618)-N(6))-methyltransferase RlmF [Bacteroidota bacterium]